MSPSQQKKQNKDSSMFRYISSYLPFILISLFIYAYVFYQHQQTMIIEPPLMNSGQQAVQVDFLESEVSKDQQKPVENKKSAIEDMAVETKTEIAPETLAVEKPIEAEVSAVEEPVKSQDVPEVITHKIKIIPKNTNNNYKSENYPSIDNAQATEIVTEIKEKPVPIEQAQVDSRSEIETSEATISEKVIVNDNQAQSTEITEPETKEEVSILPVSKTEENKQESSNELSNKTPEEIKIANEKLHKSIQETPALIDATLKGDIFNENVKLQAAESIPTKTVKKKSQNKKSQEKEPVTITKAKPVFKKQLNSENAIANSETQGALQEAIVVSGNKPVYPQLAILRSKEGRVVVTLTVTRKGKPENAQITTSSGHDILDETVLDFVNSELFMPALKGEEKVTSEQVFSFRFELQ